MKKRFRRRRYEVWPMTGVMTAGRRKMLERAVLDCSDDVILFYDRELKICWANGHATRLCADPIGRHCHEIFCGTRSFCDHCPLTSDVTQDSDVVDVPRLVVASARDESLSFRLTSVICRDKAGDFDGFIVIGRDVSRRLELEQQLRHSTKMEAIGTLAGGLAHDFNNILTPILGYTEIMRMNFLNRHIDRRESLSYIDHILAAAKKAHKLVEQILVFSRSKDMHESPQSIHPLVKEGLRIIQATLPSTIEVRQQIDEDCGLVSVDPFDMHHILLNLCRNAVEAMAADSGILHVVLKRADRKTGGKRLELSIGDTGCGIPLENLDRIFDPYFTTKEKTQGTGMGLATVHGIVTRQGGAIAVSSKVGQGTTITISLPVLEEEHGGAFLRRDRHVLLVDDEKHMLKATADILRKLGYRVTEKTSAREAILEYYRNQADIDLVMTDFFMPYMTGLELCEKIMEVDGQMPVLLLATQDDGLSRDMAMAAGASAVSAKPVTMGALAMTLRQVLESR